MSKSIVVLVTDSDRWCAAAFLLDCRTCVALLFPMTALARLIRFAAGLIIVIPDKRAFAKSRLNGGEI